MDNKRSCNLKQLALLPILLIVCSAQINSLTNSSWLEYPLSLKKKTHYSNQTTAPPRQHSASNFQGLLSVLYVNNQGITLTASSILCMLSAFQQGYNCQSVLIVITEEWRRALDQNKKVRAILMDLPKAFDCVPSRLLLEKLGAHGMGDK